MPEQAPPPDRLVADGDRERAVAALRAACGEGRLTLDEFADRVGDAWAARTWGDLETVRSGLPTPSQQPSRRSVVAVFGSARQRGRWRPAPVVHAVAAFGGAEVDLVDAVLDEPRLVVRAWAVFGGIEVVVPHGVSVELTGASVFGSRSYQVRSKPPGPGAPEVEVRAVAVFGGVTVRNRHPRPG